LDETSSGGGAVMNVFKFEDYKDLALGIGAERKGGARGLLSRMSRDTRISATTLSYVFKGKRELTPEQAIAIAIYLQLGGMEQEYFLTLVDRQRAGTPLLRAHLDRKLAEIRREAEKIENRLPHDRILEPELASIFYSMWYYSAIRNLTATANGKSALSIAKALDLPLDLVKQVLEFLVGAGLCTVEGGSYGLGPRSLVIGKQDKMVHRMHIDWRQLTISRLQRTKATSDDEVCLTMPCALSDSGQKKLRKLLLDTIERAGAIVDECKEEHVSYLCLDLFRLT
jgi:uncharacterized protein (TIGR02147 family)